MKYKYVLFDLDGTITDPFDGITASIIYALDKFGISVPDRKELAAFIGPPLVDSFSKYYGFSHGCSLAAVGYYREYYGKKGEQKFFCPPLACLIIQFHPNCTFTFWRSTSFSISK